MNTRVVLLAADGFFQRHLARRLAETFELVGVVAQKSAARRDWRHYRRYVSPLTLVRHLVARSARRRDRAQAEPLYRQLFYRGNRAPAFPGTAPRIDVKNINSEEVVRFIVGRQPDIVCVNGTNLLRRPILDLTPSIEHGIINLHTGLSPYSRGGNCNLFMLLEGHPELVGYTIHHIDPGIDSGDIILSAQVDLQPADTFERIDAKTFHEGIEAMLVAVRQLVDGRAERVPQWEKGKLFLKRTGFVYDPYQRVQVNRLLRKGLIREYLSRKSEVDAAVRLVGRLE